MLLNCGVEKTLESPLDCKEIQPANPKGNQSWIFIGETDAEADTPILWPHDVKNWLIEKDPDAGKDWRREEKGMTEVEMVGCYHRLDGHESEQAPVVGDGQGSLTCCSPWGCTELDTTERLNWGLWALDWFTFDRNPQGWVVYSLWELTNLERSIPVPLEAARLPNVEASEDKWHG